MRTSRALGPLAALLMVALTPTEALAADRTTSTAPQPTAIEPKQQYRTGIYTDGIGPAIPNDQVGFAGRLTDSDTGDPVPNATVTLQRRLRGEKGWTAIDSGKTEPARSKNAGWAVFTTDVVGNGRYRISFAGQGGHAASVSAPMKLRAMRDLNARLVERGTGARKRVSLAGNINPGWESRQVLWQRKKCGTCHWQRISQRKASRTGGWHFRAAYPPLHRSWFYRAKVRKTDRFVASYSRVLRTRTVAGR